MQFRLLDSIEEYEKDNRLVGYKLVHPEEQYLEDHFPEFPVMPGVFMLEAATQASAWLLRLSDDMQHSTIALKQARNIKYADFVKPGERLRVETELMDKEDRLATFKISGFVEERTTLSGRIVLERYNLVDTSPDLADIDERLRIYFREWQQELTANLATAATV